MSSSKKVQQLKLVDGIMAAWNKLKDFFKNLWSDVSSGAFDFLKPVTDLWDKFTDNAQNTTNLIPAKNENTKAIKLPDLKHLKTDVVRNQSNNFNITINAVKNDDSESITDKVMNRVSDFSKTFLYDPVPEVL